MEETKQTGREKTFSSSAIHRLVGKGSRKMTPEELVIWKELHPKSKAYTTKNYDTPDAPFDTYVEEKQMERDLGRSLNSETSARASAWGTLVEEFAFEQLGLEYRLVSKERFFHPDFPAYWSGMPDLLTDHIVGDIKCPWTMKSFCQLVKWMKDPILFREKKPEFYWQLVSNAILCDRDTAFLVVFCPYKKHLEAIRKLSEDHMGELNNKFSFIQWSEDNQLPFLIEGEKYSDLNVMEFKIPQEDKDILTMRVEMAVKQLENNIIKRN